MSAFIEISFDVLRVKRSFFTRDESRNQLVAAAQASANEVFIRFSCERAKTPRLDEVYMIAIPEDVPRIVEAMREVKGIKEIGNFGVVSGLVSPIMFDRNLFAAQQVINQLNGLKS